jgi:hypothetical protein
LLKKVLFEALLYDYIVVNYIYERVLDVKSLPLGNQAPKKELKMNFVKFEDLRVETMANDAFSYNSFTIELEVEYIKSVENVKKALENIYTTDNDYSFTKDHPSFPEEIVTRFDPKNKKHQEHLNNIASEVFTRLHSDD